jgi:methylenetetrahydrofolate reductase (NADPH)
MDQLSSSRGKLVMGIFRGRQRSTATSRNKTLLDQVERLHFELIPTPKVALQYPHLPAHSTVSITCSPAKDIEATLEVSSQLLQLGHQVIPHLAARMVSGPDHVAAIATWLRANNQHQVFVIGGDAPEPAGPYLDAAALITALVNADTPLTNIGFGAYPDGHATIPTERLLPAVLEKQQILDDAGVTGWISTQMCFDVQAITRWTLDARTAGLHLPLHLGIPGVIDTTKLLTMGAKLGIGASLRYLRKNRAVVSKLAAPGGYDPMQLLAPLAPKFDTLGIEALHVFTFNQVANTAAWRDAVLGHVSTSESQGSLQHGISI